MNAQQTMNKLDEGELAVLIIREWKTTHSIRIKFGRCLAKYADYRQGKKNVIPIFSRGYN